MQRLLIVRFVASRSYRKRQLLLRRDGRLASAAASSIVLPPSLPSVCGMMMTPHTSSSSHTHALALRTAPSAPTVPDDLWLVSLHHHHHTHLSDDFPQTAFTMCGRACECTRACCVCCAVLPTRSPDDPPGNTCGPASDLVHCVHLHDALTNSAPVPYQKILHSLEVFWHRPSASFHGFRFNSGAAAAAKTCKLSHCPRT